MSNATVAMARAALQAHAGLAEVTHPFQGGSHDFRMERLSATDTATFLRLGGEDYRLRPDALASAIHRIPGGSDDIVQRWPLDFVLPALNYFFDHKEGDFKMLVDSDGQVQQFVKPSTLVFDPVDVLDAMVDAVATHGHKESVLVHDFAHSLESTTFSVCPPASMAERFIDARPGDRTLGGLWFSGSLLGKSNPELTLYTNRVECSNGMTSPAGVSRFKVGRGGEEADGPIDRLREWLASTCTELYGQPMTDELERIRHLTEHSIHEDHLGSVLNDLYERNAVPSRVRAAVQEALIEEGDGTMYGVVQAFTRAAQHSADLSDSQRQGLMRAAGATTLVAQEVCESCERPLPMGH